VKVELVDWMGNDRTVINAMLVSTSREAANNADEPLNEKDQGRLGYLMKNHHASPFEHCIAQFFVECTLETRSEWQRHRTQSYNEFSFRYSSPAKLDMYVPPTEDMRTQVGKPGYYTFEPLPANEADAIREEMAMLFNTIEDCYNDWIERGLAREVARGILPVNTITKFYATGNLRNWLNFLVLRNSEYAKLELRRLAESVEEQIAETFPVTYKSWTDQGRPQL
jgi:thymidylate synthase (FAD)